MVYKIPGYLWLSLFDVIWLQHTTKCYQTKGDFQGSWYLCSPHCCAPYIGPWLMARLQQSTAWNSHCPYCGEKGAVAGFTALFQQRRWNYRNFVPVSVQDSKLIYAYHISYPWDRYHKLKEAEIQELSSKPCSKWWSWDSSSDLPFPKTRPLSISAMRPFLGNWYNKSEYFIDRLWEQDKGMFNWMISHNHKSKEKPCYSDLH